jgi:hypothetical protein
MPRLRDVPARKVPPCATQFALLPRFIAIGTAGDDDERWAHKLYADGSDAEIVTFDENFVDFSLSVNLPSCEPFWHSNSKDNLHTRVACLRQVGRLGDC